tara:strand:- start:88 stop:747 length:660 start_codon:yes stop_codon:yes gene_type:complete
MNKGSLYFFLPIIILSLIGCKKGEDKEAIDDFKSYITDFQLKQENASNDTIIKINSPKAVIDPTNNDIEIFDSSIKILNNNSNDIKITSGKSILNNTTNKIKVFNNVYISLLDSKNSFIKTNNLDWDLNTSNITLNSPLKINFDNTQINSSYGSYNVESSVLNINNNIFNRSILNKDGDEIYQITILADKAKWLKESNSLEFISNEKQVETTINFLTIK